MVITKNKRLENAFALICAMVFLWGTAGQGSSLIAAEIKHKGGLATASPERSATAGIASGYISLNGKRLYVHYAYAMAQPNAFDDKKLDIAVLVTEKPLSANELKDAQRLEYVVHKKRNYALFKINDQGKPIYEVIEHPVLEDTRLIMSGTTVAQFVADVLSKDRIQGSFRTGAKKDFSVYTYEINVSFNAQIEKAKLPEPLPDAETGKALPPDGGDPAKAYFAYRLAIEQKDVAAFRRLSQPPTNIEMPDAEMKESLEFMASLVLKDPKVIKGYINTAGDRSALYLIGTEEGEKRYGTIEMIKKNDAWIVKGENWSDIPHQK